MEAMKAQATPTGYGMKTLDQFVGQQVGLSDWIVVDQRRIDEFADCTGDRQWIHVDAERASRESPYGGTIAHGYLTLSLAASLTIEAGVIPARCGGRAQLRARQGAFHRTGKRGARVRNRVVLQAIEDKR